MSMLLCRNQHNYSHLLAGDLPQVAAMKVCRAEESNRSELARAGRICSAAS